MDGPWLILPAVGAIRVSTVAAALALAAVILWRRRSPLLAVVAVFAWAAAYEIAFTALGTALHGWSAAYLLWLAAALAGWVILAAVMHVAPDRWFLIATLVAALVWIATGFHANSPTGSGSAGFDREFSLTDDVLNELTKTLLAAAYLVGALRAPAGKALR